MVLQNLRVHPHHYFNLLIEKHHVFVEDEVAVGRRQINAGLNYAACKGKGFLSRIEFFEQMERVLSEEVGVYLLVETLCFSE